MMETDRLGRINRSVEKCCNSIYNITQFDHKDRLILRSALENIDSILSRIPAVTDIR